MRQRRLLWIALIVWGAATLAGTAHSASDEWHGGWRMITGPEGVAPLPHDLTADEVRHMMEHHLMWEYGQQLELGKVVVQGDDIVVVEVTTPNGYLVQRLEVNRHTGWFRPAR